MSIQTIVNDCLSDDIQITSENVLELKQEMIQSNHHKILMDIRYMARIKDELIEVYVEIQDQFHVGYPFIKRGIVYSGCLIVNQLGTVIQNSRYENTHKVLGIWIFLDPPKKLKNSIRNYMFDSKGYIPDKSKDYDLIQISHFYLGNNENDGLLDVDESKGLRLLETLYSAYLEAEEKKRILEEDFKLQMTKEIEEDIDMTCDFRKYYYRRGIEQGIEQGIAESTLQFIRNLMKSSNLSAMKAMELLLVPENKRSEYAEMIQKES